MIKPQKNSTIPRCRHCHHRCKDIIVSDTDRRYLQRCSRNETITEQVVCCSFGAFTHHSDTFKAMTTAVSVMGLSGELAYEASKEKGTGSFRVAIIDTLSKMDDSVLGKGAKIEYKE